MNAIEVQQVSKTYNKGSVQALNDVSLQVERGELYGLIGPDGAGKTSLFRILTTVLMADRGSASVDGFDVQRDFRAIRKRVGYMPGRFSLYQDLTVEENIRFFAKVFRTSLEENYELVRDIYVQLEPFRQRRAGKLSGGMKQKLALCCALIHKPSVLFLDEPTTGVDPVSRHEFWEMLKRLRAQEITILVSTPYMDEASLCDRVAFVQQGNILSINTPDRITEVFTNSLFAVHTNEMFRALMELRTAPFTQSCYGFGDAHHLTTRENNIEESQIVAFLESRHNSGVQVRRIKASIEDTFMSLAAVSEGDHEH